VLAPAAGPRASFLMLLRAFFNMTKDRPVLLLIMLRVLEEFSRWWLRRRQFNICRLQILRETDEVDIDVVQGCLLSLEQLMSMGRVEKRTLFTKPILEVLRGNEYLRHELRRATIACRQQSSNCLVMRWLPADPKYHTLQACLNEVSSLFGQNFVHFNALDGETTNLFKSTWYCLTVMMPTRDTRAPQKKEMRRNSSTQKAVRGGEVDTTCTFTDMTRQPRATLRVVLVNETELRRVADGKLRPPAYGFFNERHAERFRMITDFGRNFQKQLIRTPANSRSMHERNPFTSEKVHTQSLPESKPDGGHMKRVHSVPNMNVAAMSTSRGSRKSLSMSNKDLLGLKSTEDSGNASSNLEDRWEQTEAEGEAVSENNCFLRLHIPHYIGHKEVQSHPATLHSHDLDTSTPVVSPLGVRRASKEPPEAHATGSSVRTLSNEPFKTFGPRNPDRLTQSPKKTDKFGHSRNLSAVTLH